MAEFSTENSLSRDALLIISSVLIAAAAHRWIEQRLHQERMAGVEEERARQELYREEGLDGMV